MDFALSTDQEMLRDSVARLVADVRQASNAGSSAGVAPELWRQMGELGWLAAGAPESLGGFGGPVEAALVAEELGRGLLAAPFLASGVLGLQLLVAAAATPEREVLLPQAMAGTLILAAAFSEPGARGNLAYVRTRAEIGAGEARLTGRKTLVLNGNIADRLIVSARSQGEAADESGVDLFLVEPKASGVQVIPTPLLDGSAAATIIFEAAPAMRLGAPGQGLGALRAMAQHGIACIAAEAVGMMSAVIELTAQYVAARRQFGVPLSSFQVMQHRLADMVIDLEMAQAMKLVALAAFELPSDRLRQARFAGVKFALGEALRRVTGSAVQAHGGMGMAQESAPGRYLQRMAVLDCVLGASADQLGRYLMLRPQGAAAA